MTFEERENFIHLKQMILFSHSHHSPVNLCLINLAEVDHNPFLKIGKETSQKQSKQVGVVKPVATTPFFPLNHNQNY